MSDESSARARSSPTGGQPGAGGEGDRDSRLLDAVLSIASDLELESVLGRIVRAACDLVDARFGALGVIDDDGDGLAAFVHHGVDEATVRRIGDLPRGRGLLGLLIEEPTPLRLADIAAHPASYGFPPDHPEMRSFLGAPIRVRDRAFGNLYLSEKVDGSQFTAEDERLVVGLATVAGAAIANARLYEEARRREAWRDAVLGVAETVLAGEAAAVVRRRIAELAIGLVDAEVGCIVEPEGAGVRLLAAVGDGPDTGQVVAAGRPVRTTLATGDPSRTDHGPILGRPSMWVPIRLGGEIVAALGVGRDAPFTATEEQLLAGFGAQVSFAWSFERAQAEVRRLSLVEDRERIGRDLHDTVIQRLFATGLSLQAIQRRVEGQADLAVRLEQAVDEIDETIKQIRTTIFALQSSSSTDRGLRSQVLEVVEEVAPLLPRSPRVRFEGPIDTVAPAAALEHLRPVVREALTNVARHAGAREVEVEVVADGQGLWVRVVDDGRGIDPEAPKGFGLANLGERARSLGGRLEVGPGTGGRGTSVRWWLPTG